MSDSFDDHDTFNVDEIKSDLKQLNLVDGNGATNGASSAVASTSAADSSSAAAAKQTASEIDGKYLVERLRIFSSFFFI